MYLNLNWKFPEMANWAQEVLKFIFCVLSYSLLKVSKFGAFILDVHTNILLEIVHFLGILWSIWWFLAMKTVYYSHLSARCILKSKINISIYLEINHPRHNFLHLILFQITFPIIHLGQTSLSINFLQYFKTFKGLSNSKHQYWLKTSCAQAFKSLPCY